MPEFALVAQTHPFRTASRIREAVPIGASVGDVLLRCGFPRRGGRFVVYLDGRRLEEHEYSVTSPRDGQVLVLRALAAGGGGGGGKQVARIVATIALLVLTVYTAGATGPLLPALGVTEAAGFSAATISAVSAAATAVLATAGSLAINALLPLPGVSGDTGFRPQSNPLLTGVRNTARPYAGLPRVYGTHRITPDLAAETWVERSGSKTYLRLLFCFGRGPLEFSDLRIGRDPLFADGTTITYDGVMTGDGAFDDVELEIRQGTDSDAAITLYPDDVHTEALSIKLAPRGTRTEDERRTIRRTQRDTTEISVDVAWPLGLVFRSDRGSAHETAVSFKIAYRAVGDTTWTPYTGGPADSQGKITVRGESEEPIFRGYRWTVPSGEYDVSLVNMTPRSTEPGLTADTYWTALRSIRKAAALVPAGVAHVAMRIRQTHQINGTVDTFSALAQSVLRVWNGSAWVEEATGNSAAVYLHLLQGDDTERPIADAQVDLDTIKAACVRCTSQHRECNAVFEGEGTLLERLRIAAATMRGSFHIRDGQYSLLFDDEQATPVQLFSPRNSWGFRGTKIYPELPHALRVRYRDPEQDYELVEQLVYDDGYSETGVGATTAASRFEDVDFPGYTNPRLVWADARYHQAVARLRTEQFAIHADMEHLVCTRGDFVRLAHDVIDVGIAATRVKVVTLDGSGNCTAIDIEGTALLESGTDYGVCIRKSVGSMEQLVRQVVTVAGEQSTLTFSSAIASGDPQPVAGDLVVIGVLGAETIDCLVKSIEPEEDLAALLTLVPLAPAVYDADQATAPSWAVDRVAGEVEESTRAPTDQPAAPTVLDVSSSAGNPKTDNSAPAPAAASTAAAAASTSSATQLAGGTIVVTVAQPTGKKKPKKKKSKK